MHTLKLFTLCSLLCFIAQYGCGGLHYIQKCEFDALPDPGPVALVYALEGQSKLSISGNLTYNAGELYSFDNGEHPGWVNEDNFFELDTVFDTTWDAEGMSITKNIISSDNNQYPFSGPNVFWNNGKYRGGVLINYDFLRFLGTSFAFQMGSINDNFCYDILGGISIRFLFKYVGFRFENDVGYKKFYYRASTLNFGHYVTHDEQVGKFYDRLNLLVNTNLNIPITIFSHVALMGVKIFTVGSEKSLFDDGAVGIKMLSFGGGVSYSFGSWDLVCGISSYATDNIESDVKPQLPILSMRISKNFYFEQRKKVSNGDRD